MTPVYLEDFVVLKPPEEWTVDVDATVEAASRWKCYTEEGRRFGDKVFNLTGMSRHGTYIPPWINPQHVDAPENNLDRAHDEAIVSFVGTVRQLLDKTKVAAKDIDILVTACSIYCPTPSLSSLLVHEFGFRDDIISFSLGGMGCSSGVLGVQLVQDLLQAHPNKRALFVAAEITTAACYTGKELARMLANTLFRVGGAAALLTNKLYARNTANYVMMATTRVHSASDSKAYDAARFSPDAAGISGVCLSRDLPKMAGKVLEKCMRNITPKIMTWGQYAEAAAFYLSQKVYSKLGRGGAASGYMPDFTKCIDHFALHAGGYVVVKALQQGLRLPPQAVMPSLAALRDYGNTSVSMTWYVWAYCESVQHIRRGHKVLQVGVGSGIKGAVIAWQALRDIPDNCHPAWEHLAGRAYQDCDLPRSLMEDARVTKVATAAAELKSDKKKHVELGQANDNEPKLQLAEGVKDVDGQHWDDGAKDVKPMPGQKIANKAQLIEDGSAGAVQVGSVASGWQKHDSMVVVVPRRTSKGHVHDTGREVCSAQGQAKGFPGSLMLN